MTTFKYSVEYYDDIDGKTSVSRGYTVAESYAKAMENIVKYFGENNMGVVILIPMTDDSVIEIENKYSKDTSVFEEWGGPMLNEGF